MSPVEWQGVVVPTCPILADPVAFMHFKVTTKIKLMDLYRAAHFVFITV